MLRPFAGNQAATDAILGNPHCYPTPLFFEAEGEATAANPHDADSEAAIVGSE
jgi:hypothetical protein